MKALSIRQPWASLIIDGPKRIENRTWKTTRRGWVLVHASLTDDHWNAFQFCQMRSLLHTPTVADILRSSPPKPQSGIIGAMRIDDCVETETSPWFTGPWGFVIGAVVKLPFLPVRGAQGFFEVDLPTGGQNGQTNYFLEVLAAIQVIDPDFAL